MPRIQLTRIYAFSAAHRLHSKSLSDAENLQVYDKCNNLYGHGHDYYVEITVAGQTDADTGMIISLTTLDKIVTDFLSSLEHKHLNLEVPYFKNVISTGENIIQYLWKELAERIPQQKLEHIRLWETNNNYFDMGKTSRD